MVPSLLSKLFFSHRFSYNSCWGQYFSECCLINTELPRYLHYVPKMYLFAVECFKILLPFSMRCYHRCTDFTIKRLVLARTNNKFSIVSWKTAITVLQWTLHSQYFRSTRLIEMRSLSNIHPWKKKKSNSVILDWGVFCGIYGSIFWNCLPDLAKYYGLVGGETVFCCWQKFFCSILHLVEFWSNALLV